MVLLHLYCITIVQKILEFFMAHLEKIRSYLEKIDKKKPALTKELNDWYRVELAYSSNALEGNNLTKSETALVIEKGVTSGGKTLKEHLEATNHAYAFNYALTVAKNQNHKITFEDIHTIHNLIVRDIDTNTSGPMRTVNIRISGVNSEFPDPVRVPELMDDFFVWLHSTKEHPIIRAAQAHLKLLTIHPFSHQNGKTARLFMNLLLIQVGYPPVLILPEQRTRYFDVVALAQQGDFAPYYEFIILCLEKSLESFTQTYILPISEHSVEL